MDTTSGKLNFLGNKTGKSNERTKKRLGKINLTEFCKEENRVVKKPRTNSHKTQTNWVVVLTKLRKSIWNKNFVLSWKL